MAELLRI